MKNYIVRNCPAFVLMRTATSGTYFNMCGIAKGHTHCKDITNCVMKRIVELCDSNVSKVLYEGETSKIKFVEGNPLAKKILELLEIEEMDER